MRFVPLFILLSSACFAQESRILLDAVNHDRTTNPLKLDRSHQKTSDSIFTQVVEYFETYDNLDGLSYDESWYDGVYIYEDADIGYIEEHLRTDASFRSYLAENPNFKSMCVSFENREGYSITMLTFYN